MRSALSLLEELRAVDESSLIEAKTASKIDKSVLETVCAFANEPGLGGGYLLLGVAASSQMGLFSRTYEVVGVPDADQIQSDLASQCATVFNRPIRPKISSERVDGHTVLVVFIEELTPADKPLFIKKLGLPRGAYRRVGATDQEGTEDDLIVLYQGRQVEAFDAAILRDADLDDFDSEALRVYRELRRDANPDAEELTWSDADLLRSLGATANDDGKMRPTVAGILLFGSPMALRRCFPMMRIDYVRIPGRKWVENPDRRFDTIEIRAPLLLATRRAVAAIRDDLPTSFRLPEGEITRADETLLPMRVLREAIVNAVMHRSYRIHGAIQILRYANRIEIRNPGHSLKAEEQLGEPGSETRNPHIAAVLHDVHFAETKGSGIRVMRDLMLQNDLLPPTFESSRRPDRFVATFLFHHFLEEADIEWLGALSDEKLSDEESKALVFVREAGAIDNAAYRELNGTDTLQASSHLRRLRDLEILVMKGSGSRTYYVPGPRMKSANEMKLTAVPEGQAYDVDADPHMADVDPHMAKSDPHMASSDPHMVTLRQDLPKFLEVSLEELGKRPRSEVIQGAIVDLCTWKALGARDLALLLGGRDRSVLVRQHLAPMIESKQLAYVIPETPRHPDQKYKVPSRE